MDDMEAMLAEMQQLANEPARPSQQAPGAGQTNTSALNISSSSSGIEVVGETPADGRRPRRESRPTVAFDPSASARGTGLGTTEPSAASTFAKTSKLDAGLQVIVDKVKQEEDAVRRLVRMGMPIDEDLYNPEMVRQVREEVRAEHAHHHSHGGQAAGHSAEQPQPGDAGHEGAGHDAMAAQHEDAATASTMFYASRVPLLEHAVPLFTTARTSLPPPHPHGQVHSATAPLPWMILSIAQGSLVELESLQAMTIHRDLCSVCEQVGLPLSGASFPALPSLNTAPLLLPCATGCTGAWRTVTETVQTRVPGHSGSTSLLDRCWVALGAARGVGAWKAGMAVHANSDAFHSHMVPMSCGLASCADAAWAERMHDATAGGGEDEEEEEERGNGDRERLGADLYAGWSALHPRGSRARGSRAIPGAAIGHYDVHHGALSSFLWQGSYNLPCGPGRLHWSGSGEAPMDVMAGTVDLADSSSPNCFSPAVWAASLLLLGANLSTEGWNLEQLSAETCQLLHAAVSLLAPELDKHRQAGCMPGRVQSPPAFCNAVVTACDCLRVCLSARAVIPQADGRGSQAQDTKDEEDMERQSVRRAAKRARSGSGSTQAVNSTSSSSTPPTLSWCIPSSHIIGVVLLTYRLMLDPVLNGLAQQHNTAIPALLNLLHTACDVLQLRSCCEEAAAGAGSRGWEVVSRTDSETVQEVVGYSWRRAVTNAWVKWTLPEAFGLLPVNAHIVRRAGTAISGSAAVNPSPHVRAYSSTQRSTRSFASSLLVGVDCPIIVEGKKGCGACVMLLPTLLCPLHVAFSPSELGSWLTRRASSSVGCQVALWIAQEKEWRQALVTQYHPPGTHRQATGEPDKLPCHTVAWLDPFSHPPLAGSSLGYSTLCLAAFPCRTPLLHTWLDTHPQYKEKVNAVDPEKRADRLLTLCERLRGADARASVLSTVLPMLQACIAAVERVDADVGLGQAAGLYAWIGGQRVLVSTREPGAGLSLDASRFYKRSVMQRWKNGVRHARASTSPQDLAAGLDSALTDWLQSTLHCMGATSPMHPSDGVVSVWKCAAERRLLVGLQRVDSSTSSHVPAHISTTRDLSDAEITAWSTGGRVGASMVSTLCLMAADDPTSASSGMTTLGAGGPVDHTLVGEPSTGITPGRPVTSQLSRVGLKRSLPPVAEVEDGDAGVVGADESSHNTSAAAWNALYDALPPPASTWSPSQGAFAYSRSAVSGHLFPRMGAASSLLRLLAGAMHGSSTPGHASNEDVMGASAAAAAGVTPDQRMNMVLPAGPDSSTGIASHIAVHCHAMLGSSAAGVCMRDLAHALTTAILRCGDNVETRAVEAAEVDDTMLAECRAQADALARQADQEEEHVGRERPHATPLRVSTSVTFTSPIQVLASPTQLQTASSSVFLPSSSSALLAYEPPGATSVTALLKLTPILPPKLSTGSAAGQKINQELSKAVVLAHWQRLHAVTDCLSVALLCCRGSPVPALRVKNSGASTSTAIIQSRGQPNRFGAGDEEEDEPWLWHPCEQRHTSGWYLARSGDDGPLRAGHGQWLAGTSTARAAVSAVIPLDSLASMAPSSTFADFLGGLPASRGPQGGLTALLPGLHLSPPTPQPPEEEQVRKWLSRLEDWSQAVVGRKSSTLAGEAWGRKVRALQQVLQVYVTGGSE